MEFIHKEEATLVDSVIQSYKFYPVDLLGLNDSDGEFNYISNLKQHYIRTVFDIVKVLRKNGKIKIRVIEFGAYLGVVSIALSKLGYEMTAADLDHYMQNKNLQLRYEMNNIKYKSIDLKYPLPLDDESYDCIIMCETLEHLNFNPIPVLNEMQRILSPGGYFYIALPNLATLGNRMKLLTGRSIHNSIDDYFTQMDPNSNFSVGLHWREYTKNELIYMLSKVGFEDLKHSFFHPWDIIKHNPKFYIRSLWAQRNLNYTIKKIFPSLKENQTLLCKKPI